MTTAEEIIQMALGSTQGYIDRRRQNSNAISNSLNQSSGVPATAGYSEEIGGQSGPLYQTPNGLEPGLFEAIQTLQRMSPFGPESVSVGSGYRSFDEQAQLYNDWINGVPGQARAAPPGHSRHNFGDAADLVYLDDEVRQWVHSVAPQLGLHFPVEGENWHVERIR